MILVTGGFGFIGSNFINRWVELYDEPIINIDKCTYASDKSNIKSDILSFELDINDINIKDIIIKYSPRAIIHFAAESHVDNSIKSSKPFFDTNVLGTLNLLDIIKECNTDIKFIHVSTDEVYGTLNLNDAPFTENSKYSPNSPYAASKAASDHIVRAYHNTFGLKTIITNCSNNYGINQHKEKFIPTIINSCLNFDDIPVYGKGNQIRDWLHVDDHCSALRLILDNGVIGETYNIGGDNQYTNKQVVELVCDIFDKYRPFKIKYNNLVRYVTDRLGHDFRYDIDSSKLRNSLNWKPINNFEDSLETLIKTYIQNDR